MAGESIDYEIVEHDGGWAYRLADTYSEPFPSREEAFAAAVRAAEEQRIPGDQPEIIVYEDDAGHWREEISDPFDRPVARVVAGGRPAASNSRGSDASLQDLIRSRPWSAVLFAAALGFLVERL